MRIPTTMYTTITPTPTASALSGEAERAPIESPSPAVHAVVSASVPTSAERAKFKPRRQCSSAPKPAAKAASKGSSVTNLASTYLIREAISRHQVAVQRPQLPGPARTQSRRKLHQRQSEAIRGHQGGNYVLSRAVSSPRAFTRHNGSFTPQEVDALHHGHHRHVDRGVPEEGGNQRLIRGSSQAHQCQSSQVETYLRREAIIGHPMAIKSHAARNQRQSRRQSRTRGLRSSLRQRRRWALTACQRSRQTRARVPPRQRNAPACNAISGN